MDEDHKRELAWIGDAVLTLYMREYLLTQTHLDAKTRTEHFIRATSNQFLTAFGEPTFVEAQIGQIYRDGGLQAAFAHLEQTVLPLFQTQLRNKPIATARKNAKLKK